MVLEDNLMKRNKNKLLCLPNLHTDILPRTRFLCLCLKFNVLVYVTENMQTIAVILARSLTTNPRLLLIFVLLYQLSKSLLKRLSENVALTGADEVYHFLSVSVRARPSVSK